MPAVSCVTKAVVLGEEILEGAPASHHLGEEGVELLHRGVVGPGFEARELGGVVLADVDPVRAGLDVGIDVVEGRRDARRLGVGEHALRLRRNLVRRTELVAVRRSGERRRPGAEFQSRRESFAATS